MFCRKGVSFLKKRLWHRCCTVNSAKFLRSPYFTERLWWLLLELMLRNSRLARLSLYFKNLSIPLTQDVNLTCIRRSEDVQDVLRTSYVCSIYVLCLQGRCETQIKNIFRTIFDFFFWKDLFRASLGGCCCLLPIKLLLVYLKTRKAENLWESENWLCFLFSICLHKRQLVNWKLYYGPA